jgi:hypothetical protein
MRVRIDTQRRPRRAPASRRLAVVGATAFAGVATVVVGLVVFGSSTSPERFQASLAATNLARGAAGEATLTKTASAGVSS